MNGALADLFWNTATSTPALTAVAAIGAVAFMVAHVPAIVQRLVPQLAPYTKVALLVQVLAFADLMLCIGYRIADERAEMKNLKFELSWKESELAQQKQTAEQAAKLADENRQRAEALQSEVDDYVDRLAKQGVAPSCAFTDDDIRSLRNLGNPPGSRGGNPPRLRNPR